MGNHKGYVKVTASQSFTGKEVEYLEQLLAALLRGGDMQVLARSPYFAKIYRKVLTMKRRVDLQRSKRL